MAVRMPQFLVALPVALNPLTFAAQLLEPYL